VVVGATRVRYIPLRTYLRWMEILREAAFAEDGSRVKYRLDLTKQFAMQREANEGNGEAFTLLAQLRSTVSG